MTTTLVTLDGWETHDPSAAPAEWKGRPALRLGKARPVLMTSGPGMDCYTVEAEVATEGRHGYIGIAFGARDSNNFEMVYIYPCDAEGHGEVQYDPCMNGSMTWQVYHDRAYRVDGIMVPPGEWVRLKLNVWPDRVEAFVGDTAEPQLVVGPLALGPVAGRVGVWSYCPGYVSEFTVTPLTAGPSAVSSALPPMPAGTVTQWEVSDSLAPDAQWWKAPVEPNGVLNLNRFWSMNQGFAVAYARAVVSSPCEREAVLSLGFSDKLALQVNGEAVFAGESRWDPPRTDGRIRFGTAEARAWLKPGANEILAELQCTEPPFGWGLACAVSR